MHGDSNSKFYHFVIRWRRLRNEVKGVLVGINGVSNLRLFEGKQKLCLRIDLWLHMILGFRV